jgi:hypothetical protein
VLVEADRLDSPASSNQHELEPSEHESLRPAA